MLELIHNPEISIPINLSMRIRLVATYVAYRQLLVINQIK